MSAANTATTNDAELSGLDAVLATLSVPTLIAGSVVMVVNADPERTAAVATQENVTNTVEVT